MLYKKFRSVPANTKIDNPDKQILEIPKGTIKQWVIFFDPEAADVLHVRIFYHGVQIMPWGESGWLVGFFTDSPMLEDLLIDTPPYELRIEAYNEDDSYPHEYFIHPVLIPKKPVSVVEEEEGFWEKLAGFMGLGG